SPAHSHGITAFPGLYVAGYPWLSTRGSGILYGVAADAARVAQHIAAAAHGGRAGGRADRRAPPPPPPPPPPPAPPPPPPPRRPPAARRRPGPPPGGGGQARRANPRRAVAARLPDQGGCDPFDDRRDLPLGWPARAGDRGRIAGAGRAGRPGGTGHGARRYGRP